MADFRMPSLGADMEAGTLVEWHIKPGDMVHRGQIVAVVETVKGAIDVEIFEDGVVETLVVAPGTEVPVGTVLARVRAAGAAEPVSAEPIAAAPVKPPPDSGGGLPPSLGQARPASGGERIRISPLAFRQAAALGVELATLTGTGPGGAITVDDVTAAAPAKPKTPSPIPASGRDTAAMRQAIGAAMARSKREIPHYYLSTSVDMEAASAWLERYNTEREPEDRLLYAVLLVKAVALALAKFPEFNGFYVNDGFSSSTAVHVGMAVALRGGGLVAPALHDAGEKDLGALMGDFKAMVQRARANRLRSSELTDPTITVSSLGERGVEDVFPIIYPPQVAIVGFGALSQRPAVVDGQVVARKMLTASLAGDHRVSDGRRGGLFLAEIADRLQQPERL